MVGAPGTVAFTTMVAAADALLKCALPACVAVNAQLPVPTMVSVLPATVHTSGVVVAKVNAVNPLLAVAVREMGLTPKLTGVAGAKLTVCAVALTTMVALAVALLKFALPACVAVSAQLPEPTMVNVLPATVHTDGVVLANVNAVKPLEAVAVNVIGATPNTTGVAGANVTVWFAALTKMVAGAEALLKFALPACVAVSAQLPEPTMVNVLPTTVHSNGVVLANVNAVKPLVAVAVRVIGATPKTTGVAGANVTVCAAALTTTVALADALLKFALPACVAESVQLPEPTMVSVLPATVQMVAAEVVANVNAVKPLVAVAANVIGVTPKTTGVAGANVTVCVAAFTTTVALADAVLKFALPA